MGASPQILVLPEEDRTNNAIHLDETRQPAIHGGLSRFQALIPLTTLPMMEYRSHLMMVA